MQLSKDFYLSEFIKSQTAERLTLDNTPNQTVINNLKLLTKNILQPIRDYFKAPIIVSSGYRSLSVNNAVGSSKTSQHILGQAADFEIPSIDNFKLASWIKDNLNYDQLILEFYTGGNSGWIHVGYSPKHKNQELTINKYGKFEGLKKY
jgi:uncharacterized protein YcbK (DUF882 family)